MKSKILALTLLALTAVGVVSYPVQRGNATPAGPDHALPAAGAPI